MEPTDSLRSILDRERDRQVRATATSGYQDAFETERIRRVHSTSAVSTDMGSFRTPRWTYHDEQRVPSLSASSPVPFSDDERRHVRPMPRHGPPRSQDIRTTAISPPEIQNVSTTTATTETPPRRQRRQRPMTVEEKRVARQCSMDDCTNYSIDRGLCFRHGGGKTCSVDGCGRSAKARGLCWHHGGSVRCSVAGCDRGAKSRGLCWSHGGGTKCSVADCEKTSISKTLCWTHGGGKRCTFDGCKRPASESKYNFCNRHHAELSEGNVVYEV